MSSGSDTHDRDYRELVVLYALQALPSSEFPLAEAHISACADCQQEVETLRPIIGAFVSWPTDVLRPSASLWERLARRIGAETGQEPVVPALPGRAEPEWEEAAPGISCKWGLLRLASSAASPRRRHRPKASHLERAAARRLEAPKKLKPGFPIWPHSRLTLMLLRVPRALQPTVALIRNG
jgi:hypothetical protein